MKAKILNGVLMAVMVGIGVFIMINGLIDLGEDAAGKGSSEDR